MIEELRKIGGAWASRPVGFGSREYYGAVAGRSFTLKSRAHSTMPLTGDDPFQTFWHIFVDGRDVGYTYQECVVARVKEILGMKGEAHMTPLLPYQVRPEDVDPFYADSDRPRSYRVILGERMLTPDQTNLVCHVFNTAPGPRLVDMKFVVKNDGLVQFVCDRETWSRMFPENEEGDNSREFFANGIRCMCLMARYR